MLFRIGLSGMFLLWASLVRCQTPPGPPEVSKTVPPAAQQQEATNLEDKFNKVREGTQQAVADLTSKVKTLNDELKVAQNAAMDIPQLKSLMGKINERIELLESINRTKKEEELDLEKLRYEAGLNILSSLISHSGKLGVATKMGSNLTSYGTLVNPITNKDFEGAIEAIKGKFEGRPEHGILDSLQSSGLIANPYVAAGFTAASFFVSRLKPQDKVKKFANIACVIDFTSNTASDLGFITNSLKTLDEQVMSLTADMKGRFWDYAKAVQYTKPWDGYREEASQTGTDPVLKRSGDFFTQVKSRLESGGDPAKKASEDLAVARYQMENVKFDLAKYESTLKQIDDFLVGYGAILTRNAESMRTIKQRVICKDTFTDEDEKNLRELKKQIDSIRKDIYEQFAKDISPYSKRVLFAIR